MALFFFNIDGLFPTIDKYVVTYSVEDDDHLDKAVSVPLSHLPAN